MDEHILHYVGIISLKLVATEFELHPRPHGVYPFSRVPVCALRTMEGEIGALRSGR